MTLNAGILHGKEYRGPYRKSARFDATCRPHGSCGYCQGNRSHKNDKRRIAADEQMKEFQELFEKRLWEKWTKDTQND